MIKITRLRAVTASVLIVAGTSGALILRGHVNAAIPLINTRVSLTNAGGQSSNVSGYASISKDGRYVAFMSGDSGLVTGDTNGREDVFVRDTSSGTTTRVSVSSAGVEANTGGVSPDISADGRFVVFRTDATNLAVNDTNGTNDIYLHDLQTSTTELISESITGTSGNIWSQWPRISRDGRYVVFSSIATNLVSGDTNGKEDVFVKDRKLNTMTRLSIATGGTQGNDISEQPTISCDGAFIAFESSASNLTASDTNGVKDVFVVSRIGGDVIKNITQSGNGDSSYASLSCSGESLSFLSDASNLVSGDTNNYNDIFVYDIHPETTERVSVSTGGAQADFISQESSLSSDGRCVAFDSLASTLVSGDSNSSNDVFFHNRDTGTTERMSVNASSQQGNFTSRWPMFAKDGKSISYMSDATNLVTGDTNSTTDILVSETGVTDCAI